MPLVLILLIVLGVAPQCELMALLVSRSLGRMY